MKHLEEERFEIILLEIGQGRVLSAIVHSRSLGRNIQLCIWESDDKKMRKLYFSTYTQMKAMMYWIITGLGFRLNSATGIVSNLQG